ncbi:MAG: polynucleotide adenylyltransferase PcnB, partial [Victivallales bacterium]|nr:polynucleotide adenylyltransferase PcnB [Victivallales bacterium]
MSSTTNSADIEVLRQQLSPTPCNIVRELVRAGHEAYIVGGAIRDLILGKVPKDYDISTSATPEEVRAVFGRRRCHVIGRRFRLAHVYSNGDIYEVSTFRRVPNEVERQGRKEDAGPIIWNDNCFGTLEEDALRRDFTCNCLYFDVTGDRGIIDFCGGLEDIAAGVVRCIGEPAQRFDEDPVRMLRALKLVAQCGFQLEPGMAGIIREKAAGIRLASSSRLFEELLKILNNPSAHRTFQVMHDYGFLKYFWPTLDECWNEQGGELVRHLLKLRGDSMRAGRYSNSRALALSTVVLPFIMFALNPENPAELWKRSADTDEIFNRAMRLIFEGFQLPNVFLERIRQIIGLVPRLVNGNPAAVQKALGHPEYRYARALVVLLMQLFGWPQDKLEELPEFSPFYEEQPGQGRSRRSRHRKGSQNSNAAAQEAQPAAEAEEPAADEDSADAGEDAAPEYALTEEEADTESAETVKFPVEAESAVEAAAEAEASESAAEAAVPAPA